MENLFKTKICLFLILGLFLSCSSGEDLKISVTDSDDTFEFFAKFNERKTRQIKRFVHTQIAPAGSVTGDYVHIEELILDDHTKIELEESPGKILIRLDKEQNSEASYHRIKSMCEKLKKVIEGK
ncbi:hypothetical protein [Dyadobacter bucti]|uniref:hypothetical protein n=1 Tax=Dyadobacter bucti TaxID=2572203 RepID=UPI001107BEFF|nr:hypothetical protein [Dyadobacter bucti]